MRRLIFFLVIMMTTFSSSALAADAGGLRGKKPFYYYSMADVTNATDGVVGSFSLVKGIINYDLGSSYDVTGIILYLVSNSDVRVDLLDANNNTVLVYTGTQLSSQWVDITARNVRYLRLQTDSNVASKLHEVDLRLATPTIDFSGGLYDGAVAKTLNNGATTSAWSDNNPDTYVTIASNDSTAVYLSIPSSGIGKSYRLLADTACRVRIEVSAYPAIYLSGDNLDGRLISFPSEYDLSGGIRLSTDAHTSACKYPFATKIREFNVYGVVDTVPPAIPTGLTAVSDVGQVTLSWQPNKESDLLGYYVYRNGVRVNTSPVFSPNFVAQGEGGVSYAWQVSAVDLAGNESQKSTVVNAVSYPPLPTLNLTYVETDKSVRLQWNQTVSHTYTVYRNEEKLVDASVYHFILDSPLEPDTVYVYRVVAKDNYGRTYEASIDVKTKPPQMARPSVTVSNVTHNSFDLAWRAVDYATGYEVYVADQLVYEGDALSYSAVGLEAQKIYEFRVIAKNDHSCAEYAGSTKTKAAPVPTVQTAKVSRVPNDPTKRLLSYKATSDVTEVNVYINGQLIGKFPVSQGAIELDYSSLTGSMADIKVEPVNPDSKSYSFQNPIVGTGDDDFDELVGASTEVFSSLKSGFKYLAITSLLVLSFFVWFFFWIRAKWKKASRFNVPDKPFADTSNVKDSRAKQMKKRFVVDDMPNDSFPSGRTRPYIRKYVRGKGRVYQPKTINDSFKLMGNQFQAAKSAFAGNNKKIPRRK